MNIIYKDESYAIVGACFEVYKEKGSGFLEPVYQECLEIELEMGGILFVPKQELALSYKGRPLKSKYVPDLLCYSQIIVELKSIKELARRAPCAGSQLPQSDRPSPRPFCELRPLSKTGVRADSLMNHQQHERARKPEKPPKSH